MVMNIKKTRLALAICAVSAGIGLAPTVGAATVEELSAQLELLQSQMAAMQQELQELRSKEAGPVHISSDYGDLKEEVVLLREDVDDLDYRLMEPERHAALDRIRWKGDFRFQAHSIDADIPDHINGMNFQAQAVSFMQGNNPFGLVLLGDTFTFEELKAAFEVVNQFPPELTGPLLQQFAENDAPSCGSFTQDSDPISVEAGRDCIRDALETGEEKKFLLDETLENDARFVSYVAVEILTEEEKTTYLLRVHTVSSDVERYLGDAETACTELEPDELIELACGIGS